MDAFAVAVCIGLTAKKPLLIKALIVGLYFGAFQALMPLAGYFTGTFFADKIVSFDHWIAFILLSFLGIKMIFGSFEKEKAEDDNQDLGFKKMLLLAVATSIDALAVGISFAFLQVKIIPAVSFIGVITFVLSLAGVKIGNIFGSGLKSKAEFLGGIILILIGIKILLEHIGIM